MENAWHRPAVIESLSVGFLPLKFAYVGDAAFTHDRLARSDGYRQVIGSAAHEARAVCQTWAPSELPHALVEIGPGNGVHTLELIRALSGHGATFGRYLALDFSRTLLGIARERIRSELGPDTAVSSAVWDVERGSCDDIARWRSGRAPVLLAMVGHTLGNVENLPATLGNIYSSAHAGDLLVVTVVLRRPGEGVAEILAPYQSLTFRAAALEMLRVAGVPDDFIDFSVRFSGGAVIGDAILRESLTVDGLPLAAGTRLRCFLSRRFSLDDVPGLFDQCGWSVDNVVLDDDHEHLAVMARRAVGAS